MKKLLMLLIVAGAAFSCTDDDLKPEGDFTGPKIVGFGNSFESVAYFEDEGVVGREFPVNIIGLGNGEVATEDIIVNYVIDTEGSTATEGTEFNFTDTSGQIVIPAGSTFGMFPLNVNTGNFNPTEKTQLILKLTSASGETVVGEQYNVLRIVFVGCQSQIATAAGTGYSLTVTNTTSGAVRVFPGVETITLTDINTFATTTTGTWLLGQLASPTQAFNFVDICGEITVPSQNLGNFYSNLVRGYSADGVDGMVVDADNFYIDYEITFVAGDQKYRAVYTRN